MPGMTDRDHFAAAALTGLLYQDVDDEFAMPYIVGRAYLWSDAMLRERKVPDGTGDTPATHATRGEGSERREGTEPVAWAVCTPGDGDWSPCFFHEPHAQRCANATFGSKNIVPLYRKTTLTAAEREDMECAASRLQSDPNGPRDLQVADTLRGLLARLGGGE